MIAIDCHYVPLMPPRSSSFAYSLVARPSLSAAPPPPPAPPLACTQSASPDVKVAVQYAAARASERVLVLELACEQGTRGCSLAWLSVYPNESEEVGGPA